MKKIVVLTGSFNPVTCAHYGILVDALEKVSADEGCFIATNGKYLQKKNLLKVKSPSNFILSEATRREMLSSLQKEDSRVSFWGFELGGTDPSTYKTLLSFLKDKKKQYPGEELKLYLLLGADKLKGFPHWQNAADLLGFCELLVYARHFDLEGLLVKDPFLNAYQDRIHLLQVDGKDLEDVSSTEVRRRFFAGEEYKELMNPGPYEILKRFFPSDFPPLTKEDLIRAQFLYGGRFGMNAGRLQVYRNNTDLFHAWPSWLGDQALHQQACVYRDAFQVQVPKIDYTTETACVNADCVDVAESLIREGLYPAILNLASNVSPCGGYHKGTKAQEESLAYTSTLSCSLYQFGSLKYKHIRDANLKNIPDVYPMDLHFGGIYSPCVTFFRNGEASYYSLRNQPFDCAVVTVSSLANRDRNEYTLGEGQYFQPDGSMTQEGRQIELDKIRTIFRIALSNGHDSMVLGAFGCGVYHLLPEEVSQLFYDVLQEPEFHNCFRKLVFAIYEGVPSPHRDPMGKDGKFAPFYRLFQK